jgi:hypothetical protein
MDDIKRNHPAKHAIPAKTGFQSRDILDPVLEAHYGNICPAYGRNLLSGSQSVTAFDREQNNICIAQNPWIGGDSDPLRREIDVKPSEIRAAKAEFRQLLRDTRAAEKRNPPSGSGEKASDQTADAARTGNNDVTFLAGRRVSGH